MLELILHVATDLKSFMHGCRHLIKLLVTVDIAFIRWDIDSAYR